MNTNKLLLALLTLSVLTLTGCVDTPWQDAPPFNVPGPTIGDTTGTDTMPAADDTDSVATGSDDAYDPALMEDAVSSGQILLNDKYPFVKTLSVAAGFRVDVYAEVPKARSLAIVENNGQTVVFVWNKDSGSVYAVVDTNNDFLADEVKQIAKWLTMPNGVAYRDGALYVAERNTILRFPNILTSLDAPIYDTVFTDLPNDNQHGRKYIAFWPDGLLYVPIGAPCNNCDAGDPYASITAINLDTQQQTIIARGIRNTVWFDRHPETDQLRFTDNGRDQMGDNTPRDELNQITQAGSHFGYPFCHQGTVQDPEFDTRPCSQFVAPEVVLWPHVAALGMEFYEGDQFPSAYAHDIFIAEHGSRNRSVATGYRVMMVDTESQIYEPFIQGRLQNAIVHGRPVDIKQFSDWSLLISDDYAGLLYRVSYHPARR